MIIDFEDKLDDGRSIWYEASEFDPPDDSVGYTGAVTCWDARLVGTNFPVSLTWEEESRLANKAIDLWLETTNHDFDDYSEHSS